jgi:hypothetical protein
VDNGKAEDLSKSNFVRWIAGTEIVAFIFGGVIIDMAVMGAQGVVWNYPAAMNVEISSSSR